MTLRDQSILRTIPATTDATLLMNYIEEKVVDSNYWKTLKEFTKLNDKAISALFNVTEKTYRSYKSKRTHKLSEQDQERIVALLTIFKHGKKLFGTVENFILWLNKKNFFFDGNPPYKYLNTISGIKFIDSRLTGMEYGDNA